MLAASACNPSFPARVHLVYVVKTEAPTTPWEHRSGGHEQEEEYCCCWTAGANAAMLVAALSSSQPLVLASCYHDHVPGLMHCHEHAAGKLHVRAGVQWSAQR